MSTATLTAAPATGTYAIDPAHSRIGFVARHAMVSKVRGSFTTFSGSGRFDADDPSASALSVEIDVASVDTHNADRDAHLRSDDFFAADRYPTMRFVSSAIERRDDTTFRVTGDLTIRDVTRPVTFDLSYGGSAVDPYGNTRIGLEGSTVVNRRDWGLTWNAALEAGGVLVSEKVTLEFEVAAVLEQH